jgi:hypothetical protein
MTETKSETTFYRVYVVGSLWMGGDAAMSYEVPASSLPEFTRCEDETDRDYEIRMIQCATQTGDFADVTGWEITRCESWREAVKTGESWTQTTRERFTPLAEFTEEQDIVYHNCMYGPED